MSEKKEGTVVTSELDNLCLSGASVEKTVKQQLLELRDSDPNYLYLDDCGAVEYFYILKKYVAEIAKICLVTRGFDGIVPSVYGLRLAVANRALSVPDYVTMFFTAIMEPGLLEQHDLSKEFFHEEMGIPLHVIENGLFGASEDPVNFGDHILTPTEHSFMLCTKNFAMHMASPSYHNHITSESFGIGVESLRTAWDIESLLRNNREQTAALMLGTVARHVTLDYAVMPGVGGLRTDKDGEIQKSTSFSFYFPGSQKPLCRLILISVYNEAKPERCGIKFTLLNSQKKPAGETIGIIANTIGTKNTTYDEAVGFEEKFMAMLTVAGLNLRDEYPFEVVKEFNEVEIESYNKLVY